MAEQKIFKELNKSLKYRARRSKVLAADFEDPEGSGEVTVSVADDRELDALRQKTVKVVRALKSFNNRILDGQCYFAAPSARRSS